MISASEVTWETSETSLWALAGPGLALLYAVSAASFCAMWHESPWLEFAPSVLLRLALLAVAYLVPSLPYLWLLISLFLLRRTRIYTVNGGPAPTIAPMMGKIVLITGANTGIGLETARLLGLRGARVLLGCRSDDKGLATIENLYRSGIPRSNLKYCKLDLCNFTSVECVAYDIRKYEGRVDVIINNAGVMMDKTDLTVDGNEMVIQANHLGHFLLVQKLMKILPKDARILNITSSTYQLAREMLPMDMNCAKRPYTLFGQYAQSKLANILFARELRRRNPHFHVHAIHPGLVRTDVTRNMPWYLRWPNQLFAVFLATLQKTPVQGAWTSAYVASTPNLPDESCYWVNRRVQSLQPQAMDDAVAEELWECSEILVRPYQDDQTLEELERELDQEIEDYRKGLLKLKKNK